MIIRARIIRGVVAAGIAGAAVLGSVGSADAATGAATIGAGYSTDTHQVWCVQHSINYFILNQPWMMRTPPPYTTAQFSEDGLWGPQTDAMVRWYQSQMSGMAVDGIVGKQTGDMLLYDGDPHFNGYTPGYDPGYCYWLLPSTF